MTEQITDADLQTLLRENPLAAEQLRRIMAERRRDALMAELADLRSQANGTGHPTPLKVPAGESG